MNTAQEIREITMDARAKMREDSKNNIDTVVMHYLYPEMHKRACSGHTSCEIMIPDKYRGIDCIGSYLWLIEGKGKNEKTIKVYVDDILDFLRKLGYDVSAPSWTQVFIISWKGVEV